MMSKFRQLGRQLLEESPTVLNQLSEPLSQLKANIDAVKRRTGFDVIKENYDGETESHSISHSISDGSRGSSSLARSVSSGSPTCDVLDEKEEEVGFKI